MAPAPPSLWLELYAKTSPTGSFVPSSPKYLDLLERKRDTFLALTFFFPLFPDDLLCIMAGLTVRSPSAAFFIIVLLTRPWGLLAANIFGSSLFSFSPKAIPLLVIGAALFIVGMIYGDRIEQLILNYIAKRKNS